MILVNQYYQYRKILPLPEMIAEQAWTANSFFRPRLPRTALLAR